MYIYKQFKQFKNSNMKRLTLTLVTLIVALMMATAQTETVAPVKASLESVDVMSMPGYPDANGQLSENSVDLILNISNPELAGRAIVNVRPKMASNEILQGINVLFFVKDGVPFYSVDERERALKRGAALVHLSIGQLSTEQVTVEVILFDLNGVEIGRSVQ